MLKGQEKSEDTKEVIESCKSNGHKKNNKKPNKGKENITKKTIPVYVLLLYMYLILAKMTKHFGTNQLFPLLKYMI